MVDEPHRVMAVLEDARHSLGVRGAVEGVVFPMIREFGLAGEGADREAARRRLREWLRSQLEGGCQRSPAVLACTPAEEVPLEAAALAVLVSSLGWSCRILETEFSELGSAVDPEETAVLVVWCARASDRQDAARALLLLRRTRISTFFCGDGFATAQSRRGVAGIYLGGACMEAAERIQAGAPD